MYGTSKKLQQTASREHNWNYRKTTNKIYSNINKEAKAIANNCEIAEKVDYLPMICLISPLTQNED